MSKVLIIIVTFVLLIFPVLSKELRGNINENKELSQIKSQILLNVPVSINTNNLPSNDPNFAENKNAIKNGIKKVGNRTITVFSKGYYGIIFDNNSGYYCLKDGKIIRYLFEEKGDYPKKLKIYDEKGKLNQISLLTGKNSSYNYNSKGELMGFCQDAECFDFQGNLNCTRYSY